MVNWHPLGSIWHPLERPGIYLQRLVYIPNFLYLFWIIVDLTNWHRFFSGNCRKPPWWWRHNHSCGHCCWWLGWWPCRWAATVTTWDALKPGEITGGSLPHQLVWVCRLFLKHQHGGLEDLRDGSFLFGISFGDLKISGSNHIKTMLHLSFNPGTPLTLGPSPFKGHNPFFHTQEVELLRLLHRALA